MKRKTAWIVTEEYNDYDQHGEYFIAWFSKKPSVEHLMINLQLPEEWAIHLVNGGGRRDFDDQWYNLREVIEG
jgi:hypothetical protein